MRECCDGSPRSVGKGREAGRVGCHAEGLCYRGSTYCGP